MRDQGRPIPAGLVGEVRRTVAGARLHIDHLHEEVEFDLIVRGSGSFTLGNTTYDLRPGTLIWLRPGQQHRLVRSPPLEMWVACIHPELLEPGWIAEIAAQPSRLLPGEELIDLDRLLSQVAQDSDEPATYNAGIAYAVKRAQRASRDRPPAHVKLMHPAVARALRLLRVSDTALSLTQLAEATGIAAPYLSRLLVEHTNRSFVDWRNRIRLERFMALYHPGMNLLSLSFDAGFGSYARFHQVFSDTIGCTPSEWAHHAHPAAVLPPDVSTEMPAADYGLPAAGNLSVRQRWIRLVPLIGPAIGACLGKSFLDRLLAAGRAPFGDEQASFPAFDEGLSAIEVDNVVASLRKDHPTDAEELAELIRAHDFAGTFAGVVEAFEMSPVRLSDAVTAFAIALWTAINGSADPGLDQAHAVDRQVKHALLETPSKRDPQGVRAAHAALLCHFVVVYHAIQAARAIGDPRTLDQLSVAARIASRKAFGSDMMHITLTSHGFAARD